MKKTLTLIIAIFVAISSYAQIDSELQPYYDSFMSDASTKGVSPDYSYTLNMKFVYHNRHDYIGISAVNNQNNIADILIKRHRWDTLTNTEKKITIYHELGHVLLHRAHQDHNLSIMNTGSVTESEYLANESQLIDELFKPYGNTTAVFKSALGSFSDSIVLNTGDMVLLSKGFGYPLTPFLVDIDDPNNEIYTIGNYQIWIVSNIDLNDASTIVTNGSKIIQIRSVNGGISLIQTDSTYQPTWDGTKTVFNVSSYLQYHYENLNTTFDNTPFKLPGEFKYASLTGTVKINGNVNKWSGKIIVLFYEKPYATNYE